MFAVEFGIVCFTAGRKGLELLSWLRVPSTASCFSPFVKGCLSTYVFFKLYSQAKTSFPLCLKQEGPRPNTLSSYQWLLRFGIARPLWKRIANCRHYAWKAWNFEIISWSLKLTPGRLWTRGTGRQSPSSLLWLEENGTEQSHPAFRRVNTYIHNRQVSSKVFNSLKTHKKTIAAPISISTQPSRYDFRVRNRK